MPLADLLQQLYARRRFGIRPGVERIQLLLERLGNPHHTFRSIHVVGTNGKGSTSAFLSSILIAAGLRTALFTSPHLVDFRERFRINGVDVNDEQLLPLLTLVLREAPEEATFFEIVTALAALLFAREKIEIAVMEAGMGGCSDATAVMDGMLTVVTPISLDHCDSLGNSVTEIAREKVGIARPGSTIVLGRQPDQVQALAPILCQERNLRAVWMESVAQSSWNGDGTFAYHGPTASFSALVPGIPGAYQRDNAALALTVAEVLRQQESVSLTDQQLHRGIETAHWPGRMEMIAATPRLLLDGAHNPAGVKALVSALQEVRYRRLLLVIGVMADKDLEGMMEPLLSLVEHCYCVTLQIERSMDCHRLAQLLAAAGASCTACGTVADGLSAAQRAAAADDLIVACGSLFLVGEVKALLTGNLYQGIRG